MKLIMPLAGRGSRFLAQGYTLPKPLIEIKGKSMIGWAFDSIKDLHFDELIFIILKQHDEECALGTRLKELYPEAKIIIQEGFVNGAVLTILLAREFIDGKDPIIIYNPDQYFEGPSSDFINKEFEKGVKGLIPVFYATHPKWSYAALDDRGYVSKVAEKEPISAHATVGMYIFKQGKDFVWGAEQMIKKDIRVNNEFYVCPVYNELIARGDKIKIIPSNFMWGLGTPEDVNYFEKYFSSGNGVNNIPL